MGVLKKILSVILIIMLTVYMSADAMAAEYYQSADENGSLDIYYNYDSEYSVLVKPLSESSVRISWEPAENADRYAVKYISDSGNTVKYIKNGKNYCKISGMKKGETYLFRLYARIRRDDGPRGYELIADNINISVGFDAPAKFYAAKKGAAFLTLVWSRTEGCTGYELEYYGSSGWRRLKSFASPDKTSCELSGLTQGTNYKFRLRAFKGSENDRVYSGYIYTEETTDTEVLPSGIALSGANMVYVGESFDYRFEFTDGKDHEGHIIVWSVSGTEASVDEHGKLTALSKGNIYLTVADETADISDSMLVHCVNSAADVDFVPMIYGIPITNKTYPLPADYDPGMNEEALAAYKRMAYDAAKEGLNFYIISSYRSYSRQKELYNYWNSLYGKASADRVSARPGHSEHQLGLAIDVNSCYYDFIDTAESKWLAKNCYKYGFILRYPSFASETVTGYAYEPWHIRYLGTELAKKVYDSGLTLEEYLGIDSYYR